jgi:hypothetical protein
MFRATVMAAADRFMASLRVLPFIARSAAAKVSLQSLIILLQVPHPLFGFQKRRAEISINFDFLSCWAADMKTMPVWLLVLAPLLRALSAHKQNLSSSIERKLLQEVQWSIIEANQAWYLVGRKINWKFQIAL